MLARGILGGDVYIDRVASRFFEKEVKSRGILPALVPGKPWAGGYCIEQNAKELGDFCSWLIPYKPKSYVELGVSGGGLFRFMQEIWNFEEALGVDLRVPPGVSTTGKVRVVKGDLRKTELIPSLMEFSPDLVFVDADHAYESIVEDTQTALDMSPEIVAFHDVAGLRECEGAKRHWDEVKDGKHIPSERRKAVVEFIDPEDPVGIGAVVLRIDHD